MIVKVRGIGFNNKGAELMYYAIAQQLPRLVEEVTLVGDLVSGSFAERRSAGLHHALWWDSKKLPELGAWMNTAASLIPAPLRRSRQIVLEQEINAVLDASGFAYSDQLGAGSAEILAHHCRRWKKQGKKVILMPQAFGPFKGARITAAMRAALEHCDLVFARDVVSYEHLQGTGAEMCRVEIAPDFTNLVEGRLPNYFDDSLSQPCIIPNYRMLDRTEETDRQNYLPFLEHCARALFDLGYQPYILIHETDRDHELAAALEQRLGRRIRTIQEPNSLLVKGLLARSPLVVSPRFHGLVSALSQGVPALATGWSHKYQMLMEDYGCPEALLKMTETSEEIRARIEMLMNEPERTRWIARLVAHGAEQRENTRVMWSKVARVLVSAG